ncbi:MAG TPA: glutamate formimidoyltransferase [Bryobacteraceae bacterium]|nr:glutamate formimidoyltransferase [Bryobacteraceae bacterium]
MERRLIECVPNFSEGRNPETVRAIAESIARVAGVKVLRTETDPDHNRCVITFAGTPEGVREAAFVGVAEAARRIDLNRHSGVHPRTGAADVVPFVPLEGVTLNECADMAHDVGRQVWETLGIPVYFYEAAALSPERVPLETIRRGHLAPDLGGPALHPTAGACAIGARKILIAFNLVLNTAEVSIARAIARKIRASSGGLAYVKALGLFLASRNLAQVSINLTDYEQTPLHAVFEAVAGEARALGAGILESEIIGLLPRQAMEQAAAHFLKCGNFHSGLIIENALSENALSENALTANRCEPAALPDPDRVP